MPFSRFRLGVGLAVAGGFFSVVAYATWTSLVADLNRTCWSATPASSCTSVALSAGFWLPVLLGSLVLSGAGVLLALMDAARVRRRHLSTTP